MLISNWLLTYMAIGVVWVGGVILFTHNRRKLIGKNHAGVGDQGQKK